MRFGFFFFAEYVNVFIISALTVTLFFGGWNAPFPWPWPIDADARPGPASGIGLLLLVAIVPVILTLVLRRAVLAARARGSRAGRRCIVGFVLSNLFIVAVIGAWAYIGLDWVAGLLWFLRQDLRLRVHLRLDARHAAARPDRPADGLRLEVAAAGVAAEPVRDRRRDRRGRAR